VRVAGTNPATLPTEIAGLLFTPFVASSAATRGTGLGLYIGDQIVKAHGGTVTGRSENGSTSFVVRVPRHAPEAAGAGEP